jgi:hypothetical protein
MKKLCLPNSVQRATGCCPHNRRQYKATRSYSVWRMALLWTVKVSMVFWSLLMLMRVRFNTDRKQNWRNCFLRCTQDSLLVVNKTGYKTELYFNKGPDTYSVWIASVQAEEHNCKITITIICVAVQKYLSCRWNSNLEAQTGQYNPKWLVDEDDDDDKILYVLHPWH